MHAATTSSETLEHPAEANSSELPRGDSVAERTGAVGQAVVNVRSRPRVVPAELVARSRSW